MAKDDDFVWKPGSLLPKIESHSHAKLNLLARYLDAYFATISVNPQIDRISISLIDGFSGGGAYLRQGEDRPGSPLVLLDAVARAETRLNEGRRKPLALDAKFYFVETKADTLEFLRQTLVERGFADDIASGRIVLTKGEFEQSWKGIVEEIKVRHRGGRSLFVLDQKGWSAVQFSTIRTILHELPRAEVLLTFAVDWLLSYLNESNAFAKGMARIGIEGNRLSEYMAAKGQAGYQYLIPRLLLQDIRELTGAPFFTPFFLRSERAQRDLWIVHLSKLVTARNVMVESHWKVGNASLHRGRAGMDMLGFDPAWEDGVAFDFGFDTKAGSDIQIAMANELPYQLEGIEDGDATTVLGFLTKVANHTAATREQIEGTIALLHDERQIDLISPSGKLRRRRSKPNPDDLIRLTRQLTIPGFNVTR